MSRRQQRKGKNKKNEKPTLPQLVKREVAVWSLEPSPVSRPNWTSFRPRDILSNPFPPIGIAALLAGLTQNMVPLLWAVFVMLVWIACALWPVADMISVLIGNRLKVSKRVWVVGYREGIEAHRKSVVCGVRSILFSSFCFFLVIVSIPFIRFISLRAIDHERSETLIGIRATAAIADAGGAGATVTFTNNGPLPIHLLSSNCSINSMETSNFLFFSKLTFSAFRGNLLIDKGGDGQTIFCPNSSSLALPKGVRLSCADISWEMKFALPKDSFVQTKRFRFVLPRGRNDWRQVALEFPQHQCGDSN